MSLKTAIHHLVRGRKPMTRSQQEWLDDVIFGANMQCGTFHADVEDRVGDLVFDIADAVSLVRGADAQQFAQALPHLQVLHQRATCAMLGVSGYPLEEIHDAVAALFTQFKPTANAA